MQSAASVASSSSECVVPPLLSEVLQHSSRNFERMRTQMDAINHAQLQSHIDGSERARGGKAFRGSA